MIFWTLGLVPEPHFFLDTFKYQTWGFGCWEVVAWLWCPPWLWQAWPWTCPCVPALDGEKSPGHGLVSPAADPSHGLHQKWFRITKWNQKTWGQEGKNVLYTWCFLLGILADQFFLLYQELILWTLNHIWPVFTSSTLSAMTATSSSL